MNLYDVEENESFKASIHGATCVLLAELAWYNLRVWVRRGHVWHLGCGWFYLVGAGLEVVQVWRHVR